MSSSDRGDHLDAVDLLVELRGADALAMYERAPCGYLSTTSDGLIVNVNETLLGWIGPCTSPANIA